MCLLSDLLLVPVGNPDTIARLVPQPPCPPLALGSVPPVTTIPILGPAILRVPGKQPVVLIHVLSPVLIFAVLRLIWFLQDLRACNLRTA